MTQIYSEFSLQGTTSSSVPPVCLFLLCLVRLLPRCQILARRSQIFLFSKINLLLFTPTKNWSFILTSSLNTYNKMHLALRYSGLTHFTNTTMVCNSVLSTFTASKKAGHFVSCFYLIWAFTSNILQDKLRAKCWVTKLEGLKEKKILQT